MSESRNDFDPRAVVARHLRSVRGARFVYYGITILVGVASWWCGFKVEPISEALFAGIAILTAFYLYVTTQASTRISDLAIEAPRPTSRLRTTLDHQLDLIANGVYGMLVALAALTAGGIATWRHTVPATTSELIASAATYALTANLLLTMFLVATRSFHYARNDADAIRSGAAADDKVLS